VTVLLGQHGGADARKPVGTDFSYLEDAPSRSRVELPNKAGAVPDFATKLAKNGQWEMFANIYAADTLSW
jgi:hypothetical protein